MPRSASASSSSSAEMAAGSSRAADAEVGRILLGERAVESLRGRLAARERRYKLLEGSEAAAEAVTSQEVLGEWRAKYDRLWEAHRKLQKTNHSLEDKLLRVVDKFEADRNQMTRDLASQTQKLVQAKLTVQQLKDQTGELQSDLQLAITLLQNKPSSYLSQRMGNLPPDVQSRVRSYAAERQQQPGQRGDAASTSGRKITVPIMDDVQQGNVGEDERVSAAILAKVLEERAKERRKDRKFCIDVGTQTHNWHFPDKLYPNATSASNVLTPPDVATLDREDVVGNGSHQLKQRKRQQPPLKEKDVSSDSAEVIQILRSISLDESMRKFTESGNNEAPVGGAGVSDVSPGGGNILFQASVIRPPPSSISDRSRNGDRARNDAIDEHQAQSSAEGSQMLEFNDGNGVGHKRKNPLPGSLPRSATFSAKQTDL